MTDLELTKACGEMMGYELVQRSAKRSHGWWCIELSVHYDPLHDNAQAMVLVKHFRLNIGQLSEICKVFFMDAHANITEAEDKDLNRAICLCVAALKGKNESQ